MTSKLLMKRLFQIFTCKLSKGSVPLLHQYGGVYKRVHLLQLQEMVLMRDQEWENKMNLMKAQCLMITTNSHPREIQTIPKRAKGDLDHSSKKLKNLAQL